MIALFFLATTVPLCWVAWRVAYDRGRADQKAMHEALRRFDEQADPFADVEAARHERAVKRCGDENLRAALLGLEYPPPRRDGLSAQRARQLGLPRLDLPRPVDEFVIDLRDGQR